MKYGTPTIDHFAHLDLSKATKVMYHDPAPQKDKEEEYLCGELVASRAPCVQARRLVIKVGTNVATRQQDERLAIGRLGALAEEIQQQTLNGRQVILVVCGANTVGRQRLRYQQILHSTPLQYQELSHSAMAPPSCGAAGQSILMALWDRMFHMLDMLSSQLLVSEHDFADPAFCGDLRLTIDSLLDQGVVPILNENPAADMSGQKLELFQDNDGLAAQVSNALGADLTLFLTDIDGLPWECTTLAANLLPETSRSRYPGCIATYCPDIHGAATEINNDGAGDLEVGECSTAGVLPNGVSGWGSVQWGPIAPSSDGKTSYLQSKVAAGWLCAEHGGSAVLLNGLVPGNLTKVLNGEKIGTLFDKQAAVDVKLRQLQPMLDSMLDSSESVVSGNGSRSALDKLPGPRTVPRVFSLEEAARGVRAASYELMALGREGRTSLLRAMADALEERLDEVLHANQMDLAQADANGRGSSGANRLELNEQRLRRAVDSIRFVAGMDDPVGEVQERTELAERLELDKVRTPVGVLLAIFEARPEVLPQICALAVRSGNGVLLKGGEEAHHTNMLLHSIFLQCVSNVCSNSLFYVVQCKEDVEELLEMREHVDIVVARGSNDFVQSIISRTSIPVLGHTEGVCCAYVDANVDMATAAAVCTDSKMDYPAACNAVELLLVHRAHRASGRVFQLVAALRRAGAEVYGTPEVRKLLGVKAVPALGHEFHEAKVAVDFVGGLDEAVGKIHKYGSGHTDVCCTADEAVADEFLRRVDSACVFVNASSRFSDGFRLGRGAELGISSGRIHARGPMGIDALMTTKYVLRGEGQVVQRDSGVKYTHRKLT